MAGHIKVILVLPGPAIIVVRKVRIIHLILPLPISHLCEIHMCTCITCNGAILLHAWLKIANQNGQSHVRNVLLHFNLCDVRTRIAMTCIVPRGFFAVLLKGGSFIRGRSVKEEVTVIMWLFS